MLYSCIIRCFTVRILLCAALLVTVLTATVPALPLQAVANPSGDEGQGLDLSLGFETAQPLLTLFYDASTAGEMHPCPT